MDYLEFFAGAGMARAGLGTDWNCVFSNDFDAKKVAAYTDNWGDGEVRFGDVNDVQVAELPSAKLAWASFPCQDLSQAGAGAGLKGERSGTFWPFWEKISALKVDGRAPPMVVLENVPGAITSHVGADFIAICDALAKQQYRFGAVLVDASHFVPQSRLRLFVIAISADVPLPAGLTSERPDPLWHSRSLIHAARHLPEEVRENWVWWSLPHPEPRQQKLMDIIENDDDISSWHSPQETERLLAMMSDINLQKVQTAQRLGSRVVGTIYKRRRQEADGTKRQRAEVRFDDVAGCLRTPTGGSSRQTIIIVHGTDVRSRHLQPREAARLMGLDNEYRLPSNYYEAYHLMGDGVAVPVVRFLAQHILEPVAKTLASAKMQ
jgi:DNA (cytosine-5)-methyltransferase 1